MEMIDPSSFPNAKKLSQWHQQTDWLPWPSVSLLWKTDLPLYLRRGLPSSSLCLGVAIPTHRQCVKSDSGVSLQLEPRSTHGPPPHPMSCYAWTVNLDRCCKLLDRPRRVALLDDENVELYKCWRWSSSKAEKKSFNTRGGLMHKCCTRTIHNCRWCWGCCRSSCWCNGCYLLCFIFLSERWKWSIQCLTQTWGCGAGAFRLQKSALEPYCPWRQCLSHSALNAPLAALEASLPMLNTSAAPAPEEHELCRVGACDFSIAWVSKLEGFSWVEPLWRQRWRCTAKRYPACPEGKMKQIIFMELSPGNVLTISAQGVHTIVKDCFHITGVGRLPRASWW